MSDIIAVSSCVGSVGRLHAVVSPCGHGGNVSVQQVFGKACTIAAQWRTVTTGPGRLDDHQRARWRDEAALTDERAGFIVGRDQLKPRRRAWHAASETEWRRYGAFAADRSMGLPLQHAPDAAHAQPAAPS